MLYSVQNWGGLTEEDLIDCLNQFKTPTFISEIEFLEKGIKDEMIELKYKLKWSPVFWIIAIFTLIVAVYIGSQIGYKLTSTATGFLLIRIVYSCTRSKIKNQLYLITKDKPHYNY